MTIINAGLFKNKLKSTSAITYVLLNAEKGAD